MTVNINFLQKNQDLIPIKVISKIEMLFIYYKGSNNPLIIRPEL